MSNVPFATMDSYFRYLISDANTSSECLHIVLDRSPMTLKQFATMIKYTPAMHKMTSGKEKPRDASRHLREVLEILLELQKADPVAELWVTKGNYEHFRDIVLGEDFIQSCCRQDDFVTWKVLVSPVHEDLTKHRPEFDALIMMTVYKEFDDTFCAETYWGQMHNSVQMNKFWNSVKVHLKIFSEAILQVCHAYDMCFARNKAITGSFAYVGQRRDQLAVKPSNETLFQRPVPSNSKVVLEHTKKRSTPPTETTPPRKLCKIDFRDVKKSFKIVKAQALSLKKELEAATEPSIILINKLHHSTTYRESSWWEKTLLLFLLTQRAIHKAVDPTGDQNLEHHEYLVLDEKVLPSDTPEYCRMFTHIMEPWYLCIIKNIESRCQATARIPFRDETIDSFRRMCELESYPETFTLMCAVGISHEAFNTVAKKSKVKSEVGKVFNNIHRVNYPDDSFEPQTKLIMGIVTEYTASYCFPEDVIQ